MSSATEVDATLLLQNDSNASFSALWKSEELSKQSWEGGRGGAEGGGRSAGREM